MVVLDLGTRWLTWFQHEELFVGIDLLLLILVVNFEEVDQL